MSRRDIETVCTLAAHLAFKAEPGWGFASRCAADAMALQRLGRRARRLADDLINHEDTGDTAWKVKERALTVLEPYGLKCRFMLRPEGACLDILGLPGNTLGGDEDGYGI